MQSSKKIKIFFFIKFKFIVCDEVIAFLLRLHGSISHNDDCELLRPGKSSPVKLLRSERKCDDNLSESAQQGWNFNDKRERTKVAGKSSGKSGKYSPILHHEAFSDCVTLMNLKMKKKKKSTTRDAIQWSRISVVDTMERSVRGPMLIALMTLISVKRMRADDKTQSQHLHGFLNWNNESGGRLVTSSTI